MNASASQPARDRLTADQRANEPSMEEILASIRRIISESEASASAAPQSEKKEAVAPLKITPPRPEPVPLHRGSSQHVQNAFNASIFDEPLDLRGSLPAEAKPAVAAEPVAVSVAAPAAPSSEVPLLSNTSGQSVAAAFSALSAAKIAQESVNVENLAREMMRPMLKTWLDDNLPTLVERLVRAEIERVARGGK